MVDFVYLPNNYDTNIIKKINLQVDFMKIVTTFAIVEDSLFSVLYDTEGNDELTRLFVHWTDALYLFDFFKEHEKDLGDDFWNQITIEEAVERTREEAKILEKKLLEVANKGKESNDITLSSIFKPLSIKEVGDEFEKDKLKGNSFNSWLRLYAIRIDVNMFLITGGAIKLTKTMNNRPHLIKELEKLEICKKYLQEDDEDELDIYET